MPSVSLGPDVAPAPALLPRRRRGREPDALGPPARHQGLSRDGAPPRGGARVSLHDQPRAEPARPASGVRRRRDRPAPARLAHARRWPQPRRRHLPPRQLLHGECRRHDPPLSALSRTLTSSADSGVESAAQALPPVSRTRPPRPSGLVQPDLDAPAALREGPRARRVPGQGPPVHRGREELAARQAARAARPDHPAAPQARRPRPGRADDDPVLPPDPAPALRQAAGARGDARRQPPRLSRRLSGRRRGPRPPRGRAATRPSSANARAGCGRARAPSARR